MRLHHTLLALVCAGASTSTALGQDSVSKTSGLPGDAVDAHATGEQVNDYVVDMTAFRSSWSKTFGIAPIVKLSQQRATAPDFYTALGSAQALSKLTKSNAPFLRNSYSRWTAPGFGVNDDPARNDPGTPVSTIGFTGYQFAVGVAEFSTGNPTTVSLSNAIGGVVNFTSAVPSRLYVSRVVAANTGDTEGCSLGSFAMGAVDEDGDLVLRADANGSAGARSGLLPFPSPPNQNMFTVDLSTRSAGLLNVLSNSFPTAADAFATERVQINAYTPVGSPATTTNTPDLIPRSVAGRRIVIGSDSVKEYLYESTPGTVIQQTAGAHLAAGVSDHRGSVGYTTHNFTGLFTGSVNGTAGMLGVTSGTKALNIWGLGANGVNLPAIAANLPASISDPAQPAWNNTLVTANQQFDHYHDQTLFRGGTSPVALGRDNAGNLLAAGVVYLSPSGSFSTGGQFPNCYIAVARIDPTSGVPTWSVAAWTQEGGVAVSDGKTIYQNGVTPIGRLRAVSATAVGPTMSAPMIDSFGNIWFLGFLELNAAPGTIRVGLVRAVYDAASFSYKLELVVKESDVFAGQNSGKNYQLAFLELNDGNSISSGTAWSNNISGTSFENIPPATLANDDARTLGGIVLNARIVYDVNADSSYVVGGGSPDESYNVLLYIGASSDCDGDGIPDDRELADNLDQDSNLNGIPDSCEGVVGTSHCAGDGTDTACPCSNPGLTNRGCDNTFATGGANLSASGSPSVSSPTLVMNSTFAVPFGPGLYYEGSAAALGPLPPGGVAPFGIQFGNGLRCAGGVTNRLEIRFADNVGTANSTVNLQAFGAAVAGTSYMYQLWYRDTGNVGTCVPGAGFNLSNGVVIAWVP